METPGAKDDLNIAVSTSLTSGDESLQSSCQLQQDELHVSSKQLLGDGLSDSDNPNDVIPEKSLLREEFPTSNGMDSVTVSANEALDLLEEKPLMQSLEPVSNELTDIFEETDDGQTSSENFPLSEENSQFDTEKVTERSECEATSDSNSAANDYKFSMGGTSGEDSLSLPQMQTSEDNTVNLPPIVTDAANSSIGGHFSLESKDSTGVVEQGELDDKPSDLEDTETTLSGTITEDAEKEVDRLVSSHNENSDEDETILLIGQQDNSGNIDNTVTSDICDEPEDSLQSTVDSTECSINSVKQSVTELESTDSTSGNLELHTKSDDSQEGINTSDNVDKTEESHDKVEESADMCDVVDSGTVLQEHMDAKDTSSMQILECTEMTNVDYVEKMKEQGTQPEVHDDNEISNEDCNTEHKEDVPCDNMEMSKEDSEEQTSSNENINLSLEPPESSFDTNDLSFTITNVSGGETVLTASSSGKVEKGSEPTAETAVVSTNEDLSVDVSRDENIEQNATIAEKESGESISNTCEVEQKEVDDDNKDATMDIDSLKDNQEEVMEIDTSEGIEKDDGEKNNEKVENEIAVSLDEKAIDGKDEDEVMEVDETTRDTDGESTDQMEAVEPSDKTVESEKEAKQKDTEKGDDKIVKEDADLSSEEMIKKEDDGTEKVDSRKDAESIEGEKELQDEKDTVNETNEGHDKIKEEEKDDADKLNRDIPPVGNEMNKEEAEVLIDGDSNESKQDKAEKEDDDKKDVLEIVDDDIAIISDEPPKKPVNLQQPIVKMDENDMGLQISAVSGGVDMGDTMQKDVAPVAQDVKSDVKPKSEKKEVSSSKASPPKSGPPPGAKIQCCIVCRKMGKCKYNIVRNGDIKHLCDDECFKKFRASPTLFLKPSANAAAPQQQQQPATPVSASTTTAVNNNAKYKTCSVCQLMNINTSKPFLNWQGLDFCGEECLGTFQGALNTACSHCGAHIPQASKAKYCVKVGTEVRQVCNQKCQTELKRNLKLCAFCQKDLSNSVNSFMAPVGGQGTFKDFCSQPCLQRFEELANKEIEIVGIEKGKTNGKCSVCNKTGLMKHDIKLDSKIHRLCGDPCFSAFQYANKLTLNQCDNCRMNLSGESSQAQYVQYEGQQRRFCSSMCVNQFRTLNKKIIPCAWCGTKKVNFDMIERVDANNKYQMFCSLNCLSLYRVNLQATSNLAVVCDHCRKFVPAQYHLTMSDASVRNFCSYTCVMSFQSQFSSQGNKVNQPIPASQPSQSKVAHGHNTRAATGALPQNKVIKQQVPQTPAQPVKQQAVPPAPNRSPMMPNNVPVISSVVSLAPQGNQKQQTVNLRSTTQVPVVVSNQLPAVKTVASTATPATVQQQIIIQPPPPKEVKNKSLLCKPFVQTKATSCRPHTQTKECQTEKREPDKILIPVPIPIFVPCPMAMYNIPAPYPVPIPVPIAVPCFIPTTKKSANGILKQIKEIQEKIPTDPFEAELLRMAEAVATAEKGDVSSSDSENDVINDTAVALSDDELEEKKPIEKPLPESNDLGEDMIQIALRMATEMTEESVEDLENSIEPVPLNTDQPPPGRIIDEEYDEAEYIMARDARNRRPGGTKRSSRGGGRGRVSKKPRYDDLQYDEPMVMPEEKKPPPDANLHLKFTYGINAWKHWVMIKNSQLESVSKQGSGRLKLFKTDILQCTPDELNFSLCLFVKEVRKPNGDEYASDSIYYLCLGIQQYLFENGRMDNIFTDVYFEKFTECLNDLLYRYEPKLNMQGQIVCRIEEEHLWESKQLGAHSPNVLLNTLIYFNTKYFMLKTPQEHLRLAFSQIMKHWKKAPIKGVNQGRNVYLRYYCPTLNSKGAPDLSSKKNNKEDLIVYEQGENVDNPLRCPVKLYEFYLSKCPESTKNRNDMFYLVPERSCVPDSPVWYSAHPATPEVMGKMLNRLKLVREIQEAHLHSKPEYV